MPSFSLLPRAFEDIDWEYLQLDNTVTAVLRETKFVRSGAHEANSQLLKLRELLDHDDSLPKCVFAREGRFSIEGWLHILRRTDLRTTSEAKMLLECAKKVEMLAKEAMPNIDNSDTFDVDVSSFRNELSPEIWSLAGLVMEALVYGSNQIAFVPAEKGMPNFGGRTGGKRVDVEGSCLSLHITR
eukprot:Gb_02902 [translate_table: standard]